jgi:sirohydrochlorin ferrochelatase
MKGFIRKGCCEVKRQPGILMISHGSRDRRWVALADGMVSAVREYLPSGIPAEAAFLELVEGRLIQDGIDRLEQAGVTDMFVVPLFVSSGSHHVREIRWAMGIKPERAAGAGWETALVPFRITARVTFGRPMDDDAEIAEILLDRLASLSDRRERMKESVLLIGHGRQQPELHERWQAGLASLARQVKEAGGFADADFATLTPDTVASKVGALRQRQPDAAVLAVPVFLSEGYFTKTVIPQRLSGLGCRYDSTALLPHPGAARWAARQVSEWLRQQDFL